MIAITDINTIALRLLTDIREENDYSDDHARSCLLAYESGILDFWHEMRSLINGEASNQATKESAEVHKPAQPAEQTKKTDGRAAQRKDVDEGKVAALRKAGWTERQIAEEMHISQTKVHTLLVKLHEEKKLN